EDALPAYRGLPAGVSGPVAGVGADGDVVLADQAGQVLGEAGVIDAGADELAGRCRPQRTHSVFAPDPLALLVGLQDGDRDDGAGAEVRVQLGQIADLADVRCLVQDGKQDWVEAAAPQLGGGDGGAERLIGQSSDKRGGVAGAVFGQQVQRLWPAGGAGFGEGGDVEGWQWPRRWGDPSHDLRVGQARGGGTGGLVHAVAGLRGTGLPAGDGAGGG